MRTYVSTVGAVLLVALVSVESRAAVPLLMPTQGVLRDNAGQPVGGESFEMTFAIYDLAADGDPVWTETWPPGGADCVAEPAGCVPVTGGVFSLMLGMHMSCRDHTVDASASRFRLLVGTIGGRRPDGTPGGGEPAFLHRARTMAAVSRRSKLRRT